MKILVAIFLISLLLESPIFFTPLHRAMKYSAVLLNTILLFWRFIPPSPSGDTDLIAVIFGFIVIGMIVITVLRLLAADWRKPREGQLPWWFDAIIALWISGILSFVGFI